MMMTIADWSLAVVGIGEPWVGRSGGWGQRKMQQTNIAEKTSKTMSKRKHMILENFRISSGPVKAMFLRPGFPRSST